MRCDAFIMLGKEVLVTVPGVNPGWQQCVRRTPSWVRGLSSMAVEGNRVREGAAYVVSEQVTPIKSKQRPDEFTTTYIHNIQPRYK